ncbi:MAG: hypothetical protein IPN20_12880 [Haliscomenobacter sp.]|nr:hypothetical protein [Haliscomenobacter sp.]
MDKWIRYANGITASPDGKFLYMAACTDGAIYVYQREPFQKIREIECGTGVDNLEWDAEGNLWAGAHPKMLAFLLHARKSDNRSPSQVLKINLQNPENPSGRDLPEYGQPAIRVVGRRRVPQPAVYRQRI